MGQNTRVCAHACGHVCAHRDACMHKLFLRPWLQIPIRPSIQSSPIRTPQVLVTVMPTIQEPRALRSGARSPEEAKKSALSGLWWHRERVPVSPENSALAS